MAPAPVTTGTGTKNDIDKPMNFFYSPGDADDGDASYEYAKYKVRGRYSIYPWFANPHIYLAILTGCPLGPARRDRGG